jgi:hypothetical protein
MFKFKSIGLAALLAVTTSVPALATTILYRNDFNVGTDQMAAALSALPSGFTITSTTSDLSGFTLGDFDIVIYANQNTSRPAGDGTALSAFLSGGGRLIYQDWTLFDPVVSGLPGTFTGNANQTTITLSLFDAGITNPVALTNPGWGTFSTGLLAGPGATVAGTFGNGEAAILVSADQRVIWNGFLTDTAAVAGQVLYTNQILALTGGTDVPEPASLALFAAGLLALGAAARQRRSV